MRLITIGLVLTLFMVPSFVSGDDMASPHQHLSRRYSVNLSPATGQPDSLAPGTIPARFSLYQNYPNPFNSSTTIAFDLPSDAGVHVAIYNTLGRLVRTLVNEIRSPGRQVLYWNGHDNNGKPVGSGLYVYVVMADDYYAVRKMILLK